MVGFYAGLRAGAELWLLGRKDNPAQRASNTKLTKREIEALSVYESTCCPNRLLSLSVTLTV
jgi:hypothetical protein